jgi:hypothetical protein
MICGLAGPVLSTQPAGISPFSPYFFAVRSPDDRPEQTLLHRAVWPPRNVSCTRCFNFFSVIDRVDLIVLLLRHAWLSAYFDQRSDFRLGVSTNILPLFRVGPCIAHSSSRDRKVCGAWQSLCRNASF